MEVNQNGIGIPGDYSDAEWMDEEFVTELNTIEIPPFDNYQDFSDWLDNGCK